MSLHPINPAEELAVAEHFWVQYKVSAVEVLPGIMEDTPIVMLRGDVPERNAIGCDRCGLPLEGYFNTDCKGEFVEDLDELPKSA